MAVSPRKTKIPRKTELQPIKLPNGLSYPRVEEEQRTHSGDKIGSSAIQSQQNWPRLAAIAKEENFMAFQGRQRLLPDLILPHCLLRLMEQLARNGRINFSNVKKQPYLKLER